MVLQLYRGTYKQDCGVLLLIFHFSHGLILYLILKSFLPNRTPENGMDKYLAVSSCIFHPENNNYSN